MNLTDYPTPQCDGIRFQAQPGMMPPFDTVPYTVAARIEREAAAWKDVAEYALNCLNQAAKDEGKPMSLRGASTPGLASLAHQLRDALKSQLNEKP